MRTGEYRIRAQRFLTGAFNVQDLNSLFLYLRQNSDGHQTVRDIGHMIGHSDSRNDGISAKLVNDLYDVVQFQAQKIGAYPNWSLDLADAPPNLIPAMDATYRLIGDDILLRDIGLRRDQASTALTKLRRRFQTKVNGRLEWMGSPISQKHTKLLKCLSSYIISTPVYDANKFYSETVDLFLRHRLIDSGQEELFLAKKPHLLLYALVSMRGVIFKFRDGGTSEAEAGFSADLSQHHLEVKVTITFPYMDDSRAFVFPIFTTDLNRDDWVDGGQNLDKPTWKTPIELTPDLRIREIT